MSLPDRSLNTRRDAVYTWKLQLCTLSDGNSQRTERLLIWNNSPLMLLKEFLPAQPLQKMMMLWGQCIIGHQDCNEVATAWPEATLRDFLWWRLLAEDMFSTGVCSRFRMVSAQETAVHWYEDLPEAGHRMKLILEFLRQVWQGCWLEGDDATKGPEMKMVNDFLWRRMGM